MRLSRCLVWCQTATSSSSSLTSRGLGLGKHHPSAAAADVQFDDAVWSSVHREWTWRTDGDPRLVRHEDGTQSLVCGSDSDAGSSPVALPRTFVPLVSELLQFQYRFGLHEARFLSRDLRSEDVLSLLVELENAGFLTPAP